MLICQNFSRCHQRGLITAVDRLRGGKRGRPRSCRCRRRLAANAASGTDGAGRRGFRQHALLRAGQRERQRGLRSARTRCRSLSGGRALGAARTLCALQRQLLRQQFVELSRAPMRDASGRPARCSSTSLRRIVQQPHRWFEIGQVVHVARSSAGQRIGPVDPCHRVADGAAQYRLRQPSPAGYTGVSEVGSGAPSLPPCRPDAPSRRRRSRV
jgi:hypothetical protein